MSPDDLQGGEPTGEPALLDYSCKKVTKSRTKVDVRFAGTLIHSHTFDLNNATSRASFAATLVQKVESKFQATLAPEDVEDGLLHLVEDDALAADAADVDPAAYQAITGSSDPEEDGFYMNTPNGRVKMSNCVVFIDRDVAIRDGEDVSRRFEGRIILNGATTAFAIPSDEFAHGQKFVAALFRAAGAKIIVMCKPEAVCRAISAVSHPIPRTITTDHGWTPQGDAFLTPTATIDASGVRPVGPDDAIRVDLGDEPNARHLGLMALPPEDLAGLKTHIVTDLLELHARRVTYTLLAATALAVLVRFAPAMNRPAIWLTGLTGGGKSFLGRLFASFFGDFPVGDGSRHGSWSSTANFLQRQGYFFKDAIFLIDDFKPDVIPHRDVVKILQNYADNSARGRLRADATNNVTRPIRGLLVSTGEDVPEHSASSVARTVVVEVPQAPKDIERGGRCVAESARYRAVTADFIRHLIAEGRTAGFAGRVEAELAFFYAGIAGQQNDVRIAGNFALVMAAFVEIAEYLGDAWPDRVAETDAFRAEMLAVRDAMLAEVRHQQACEIFLTNLSALVMNGQVQIHGWVPPGMGDKVSGKPIVGRRVPSTSPNQPALFDIATNLALASVQDSLRKQGRPPLALSEKALIHQLVDAGKLLDKDGQPMAPDTGGDHTWAAKVAGETKNVFRIFASELTGESVPSDSIPHAGSAGDSGGPAEAGEAGTIPDSGPD